MSVTGLEREAIVAGLQLRIPDLAVQTQWRLIGEDAGGQRPVYIALRHEPAADGGPEGAAGRVHIEMVTADGRAFHRTIAAGPDEHRVITSVTANLLFSIERDAAVAVARDVALPESEAQVEVERVAKSVAAARGELQPEAPPEAGEPAPEPAPEARPPAPEPPDPAPEPSPPSPWRLGVTASAGPLLAVGPPVFASALAGGGPALGLDAHRRATGLLLTGELRYLTRAREGARLSRIRLSFGAGYLVRRGRFEMPAALALALEPWLVNDDGERRPPADFGAPAVLLGGAARLSPGVAFALDRGSLSALRVGARVEAGGSFGISEGARVIGVRRGLSELDGDALFRLGGLELSLGLELTLWFGREAR